MKYKIFLFLIVLHLTSKYSFSQSTKSNKVETIVDKEPQLLNGDDLISSLIKNISLPDSVTVSNYTGSALVEFIVFCNGKIGNI